MQLSIFLQKLSIQLEKKKMKLIMIRNYEKLPKINIGNDLDLFLSRNKIREFEVILKNFCLERGIQLKTEYHKNRTAFFLEGVQDKNNHCKLDVVYKLKWKGITFYNIEKLVENIKIFSNPIYIPKNNVVSAYIIFCQSFLFGGFINKKYLTVFREAMSKNKDEFKSLLNTIFSDYESSYLMRKIYDKDPYIPRIFANVIRIFVLIRSYFKVIQG